jgi:predicted nucleotidyltransferase
MTFQGNQVVYTDSHWSNLASLRGKALEMMKPLWEAHLYCVVYGSIARGDTSKTSDIDIYIPNPPAPTFIEASLESENIRTNRREIIQATPSYAAKAYIYIDEKNGYSFPLVPSLALEEDFIGFAGRLQYEELKANTRVPGVNKELKLIEPNETGHTETPIQGIEGIVAKKLGVDTRIINQRIRILERRNKVGRTGVYIKRTLSPDESFGVVFNELVNSNPAIRRRLRKKNRR